MTEWASLNIFINFGAFYGKPDISECYIVIFVEKPDKTLLDWCENKWINYLNAKININRIFLSYNCDEVLNSFICSLSFKLYTVKLQQLC